VTYQADCLARFPSYWLDCARETDPSMPFGAAARCDIAVIGAGYTGLAAAIEAAAAGADVRVLDGGFVGWGGSGRNSGAVIRGFKSSRSTLIGSFGAEQGGAMAAFGDRTAQVVYDLVDRFGIDCDLGRAGWILPAHNAAGMRRTEERQASWSADGVRGLELLDRDAMERHLGSRAYLGGMIDRECGNLNPLSYARGLARAAVGLGAKVHRGAEVIRVERQGQDFVLQTAGGPALTASQVLVATNAYTAGLGIAPAAPIATIHTHMIATEPLPEELAASILPGGQTASDSRRVLYYWHKEHDGRLLFGTRGLLNGPRGPEHFAHVEKAMLSVYPQLAGVGISHRWAGRVALTRDFLPRIDQPQPGLWTAYGYCGRGVAMASAYGQLIGQAMRQEGGYAAIRMPSGPAPALPREPLRSLGVVSTTQLYRLLDLVA